VVVSVVDDQARSRTLGADAMLVKPVNRATLVQVLRQVIAPVDNLSLPLALIGAAHEQPRILLAEDNQATIDLLCEYLQAKGYTVTVAYNGNEALVCARQDQPDLILMDIQMPDMDGLAAIRHLRTMVGLGMVPIIAITALAMPGDRERCLTAGANAYLTKPLQLRTLLATIAVQLHQHPEEPQ
jgi:CheY-like chemotaxis protein